MKNKESELRENDKMMRETVNGVLKTFWLRTESVWVIAGLETKGCKLSPLGKEQSRTRPEPPCHMPASLTLFSYSGNMKLICA